MIQRSEQLCFAAKARERFWMLQERIGQDRQRGVPAASISECGTEQLIRNKQADAHEGTNESGERPVESAPWVLSTGRRSLRLLAPESSTSLRPQAGALERGPGGPGRGLDTGERMRAAP